MTPLVIFYCLLVIAFLSFIIPLMKEILSKYEVPDEPQNNSANPVVTGDKKSLKRKAFELPPPYLPRNRPRSMTEGEKAYYAIHKNLTNYYE